MLNCICFNSMKVRLKHASTFSRTAPLNSFNSMKVRLKLRYNIIANIIIAMFQFHEGPIKTATSE